MEFAELLEKFGWSGAMLVLLCSTIIAVCRSLSSRLFDDDVDQRGLPKGYVPRIVNAHLDMVDAIKVSAEENTKILRANETTTHEILLTVREGREETRAMNRAIAEMQRARIEQQQQLPPQRPSGIGTL